MLQLEVAVRILLVEDHPQLAESVAQALKGAGWTVDVLHDGVAADLALCSEEYALAILDIGLLVWTALPCWRACVTAVRPCRC